MKDTKSTKVKIKKICRYVPKYRSATLNRKTTMQDISRRLRIIVSFLLIAQLIMPSSMILAQTATIPGLYTGTSAPDTTALPVVQNYNSDEVSLTQSGNKLTVNQKDSKVVIDWESFDIGADAWTYFNQQGNTDWVALNRIYDQNPSLIYGQLTADGKIYLINQNGILFGPNSQVNVYALAASSLDIAEAELEKEFEDLVQSEIDLSSPQFSGDDDRGAVSNHGTIETESGGYIYLVAPEVENSGSLDAPTGQVVMAAGTDVEITILDNDDRVFPYVYVNDTGEKGTVHNLEDGSITADAGVAGMYGRIVNQDGYIRSITTVNNNGRIELHASEKVVTGADSVTETPITDSDETVHSSFSLSGGEIDVAGLDVKTENVADGGYYNVTSTVGTIVHNGEMTANSGTITMAAEERIYLAEGSTLDVSGLWVAQTSEDSTIEATLNSVELKNDESQQDGVLQGETIEVLAQEGSGIGDLSDYFDSDYLTAMEMATAGGDIELTVEDGDIILREGATIDFSGGGVIVEGGYYNTTKLVSGNSVYDIASASSTLQYDGLLNYNQTVYSMYGLTDTYSGLYYGGSNSLSEYMAGYIQGDDAGTLVLEAAGIVLDGTIDGSVIAGVYQTLTTVPEDEYGEYTVQTESGVTMPRGGTLYIGSEYLVSVDEAYDLVTEEVVITDTATTLPDDFDADTDLKTVTVDGQTVYASELTDSDGESLYLSTISDDLLNEAGLSSIYIRSNAKVTVEEGAEIELYSGGLRVNDLEYSTGEELSYLDFYPSVLNISAQAIEYSGTITATGGDVEFSLLETALSDIDLPARIYIADGSLIDVSGDVVDNSMAEYTDVVYQTLVDGGDISITDGTYSGGEVIIAEGSVLDVSGGYVIDTDGTVTSGSAGSIELAGTTLVLDGDVYGYSLVGESGGSITIHTTQISVQEEGTDLSDDFEADDELTEELAATLVLDDDEFADSGFSDITLKSFEDLEIGDGVDLSPSLLKLEIAGDAADVDGLVSSSVLNYENASSSTESVLTDSDQLVSVALETLGTSSITLMAGKTVSPAQEVDYTDTYAVIMSADSSIEVSPGGSITLSGLELDIAGDLTAPAGTISLAATGEASSAAITIQDGSVISAAGTNLLVEDSVIPGIGVAYEALEGGSVILSADNGSIIVAAGASIDVSGSTPVESVIYNANDINNTESAIETITTVSNAGGIYFEYYTNLVLDGELIGNSYDDSVYGGTLSIEYSNEYNGLTIDADDIETYLDGGFDALAFSSLVEIVFTGDDIEAELGLSLELDAPEISGSGQTVYFSAPAITLANTEAKYPGTTSANSYDGLSDEPDAGESGSSITLAAENIEVSGSIAISGFETTTLNAKGDIQLADEAYYDDQSNLMWQGLLRTAGDLTLQASVIYPTTASTFTLASDDGRITILPSEDASDTDPVIASVGGTLILAAEEIDHQGYLAAPLGTISIVGSLVDDDDAAETVFLAEGSVITVAGDSAVLYGALEDEYWTIEEKPTELTNQDDVQSIEIETLSEKSVEIEADTVVMQSGAEIDISGGGTAYASEFIAGTEGYENPFDVEGTYVVVPGIHEGGEAVYLEESSGLPAGVYTLLDEDYAYLDGAYVIQYLGSVDYSSSIPTLTNEGYEVVVGYDTVSGTDYLSSTASIYSIRTAEEVLASADYDTESLIAGDAGSVDIQSTTSLLEGIIVSDYIDGYDGGVFSIAGLEGAAVSSMATLGTNYSFDDLDDIIDDYLGTVVLLDSAVSGSGIEILNFGSLSLTDSVMIGEDTSLVIPVVILSADNSITLASGSSIVADQVVFNTPDGVLSVESDATVEVYEQADIVAQSVGIDGLIFSNSEGATLGIESGTIVVVPDEYTGDTATALYLTESLQGFSGFDNLELTAEDSLLFMGETELTVDSTLTLDAGLVTGSELNGAMSATIEAQNVYLINTGEATSDLSDILAGSLAINATDSMTIGHGDIVLDGFDDVTLAASGDILFSGEGSLTTAGDLTFQSARITATYYEDDDTEYEAANFSVVAGNETDGYRDITITAINDGEAGDTDIAGGLLEMTGNTILMSDASIDIRGGWVTLTATGQFDDSDKGIILSGNSEIDVAGNDYVSGGRITLTAETGSILLETSSKLDVSAGTQGDAGELSLSASQGTITLAGNILGNANGGDGGSFSLDEYGIDDLDALAGILGDGGFDESVDLRVRSGNLELSDGETLTAHEVVMTADDGDILIAGTIDASGEDGGDVEVNAGNNLTLEGTIDASATGSDGEAGSVYLNAAEGVLTLASASEIDVATQDGEGGTVHLRARQNDTDLDGDGDVDYVLMDLEGTINGASDVIVEGVEIYEDADGSITSGDITGYYADVDSFLGNSAAILSDFDLTLLNGSATAAQVVAGIEVVYDGNLSLDTEWDLTDDGRSDQAGYITLRASGDLTINESLVDHPTSRNSLNDSLTQWADSWGFNLAAGADLDSADIMAVNDGDGDLIITDGQMVYTENNTIRFASGQDTLIYGAPDTSYMINSKMVSNIATFNGDIEGYVGRDLSLMDGAVIQSATGDIEIEVGRDLYLELNNSSGSAIRTTGISYQSGGEWVYAYTDGGGDIVLDIGGDLLMGDEDDSNIVFYYDSSSGQYTSHLKYWDNISLQSVIVGSIYVWGTWVNETENQMLWSADYDTGSTTAGVATMGGGSITVVAGNDVSGQIGTFQEGDLSVTAHGDISGYYQVAEGEGAITAMGSIISPDTENDASGLAYTTSLGIFDAQVEITAQGNIDFGTIFNPTFTTAYSESDSVAWDYYLDYSETASVSLMAINGDLSLSGEFWAGRESSYKDAEDAFRVLPPTVSLTAGEDISFGTVGLDGDEEFVLAPSATGNLTIYAGGSILGLLEDDWTRASLRLSDLDPDDVYSHEGEDGELVVPDYDDVLDNLFEDEIYETTHAGATPLHSDDDTAVSIVAGGDIDLKSVTDPNLDDTGFIISGSGLFLVQAAGDIDLGVSQGIQSVGDAYYTALSEEDAALWVFAGLYQESVSDLELDAFFESIREYGTEYSSLISDGDDAEAAELLEYIEEEVIDPLYAGSATGTGNINMTNASIQTTAEGADIFILANGDLNVGKTQIPDPDDDEENDTGIFTTSGGSINIYAYNDVNVNESRVMTFRGGDITIWSDQGDINAGRGSKTAVNAGAPTTVTTYDDEGNVVSRSIIWEAPSVGSGIRTLTYDPDGFLGIEEAPDAGDAYIFAPGGVVDAGEAGISAGNVVIAATEVLNAQNIEVGGTSVGVPQANTGPSVSALAGSGTVSEAAKSMEDAGISQSAEERFANSVAEISENLVPKWLAVEVIGFVEEDGEDSGEENNG
jgi:filamentous hemagglutinin family protein